jgi:hypothetical protein
MGLFSSLAALSGLKISSTTQAFQDNQGDVDMGSDDEDEEDVV